MAQLQLLLAQVDKMEREWQMRRNQNYAMMLHIHQVNVQLFYEAPIDQKHLEKMDPGSSQFLHQIKIFP